MIIPSYLSMIIPSYIPSLDVFPCMEYPQLYG